MPVYDVTLYFHGHHKVTVEAKDDEDAETKALSDMDRYVEHVEHIEVNDAVVIKSDDQYTDQQELRDREAPYET